MANLVLLVLCFGLGVLARRSKTLPEDSHRVVNTWVMFVSLPAMVFRSIHTVTLEPTLFVAALVLWLVFLVPLAVAIFHARRGDARGPLGAVTLCAGLSNTAFVGYPLLEALGGRETLGPAAVIDQLGAFVPLFLLAIPFATVLGGGEPSFPKLLRRMVLAPGLVALGLAFALRGAVLPEFVMVVVNRLADVLSPLALAAIGWQLDLSSLKGHERRFTWGLTWKLVLAPLLVLGVVWLWRGHFGLVERVLVAQAAMAPMVSSGVVAAEHRLAPSLAATMIAVGVPLSFVTVPLWWWLTGQLG